MPVSSIRPMRSCEFLIPYNEVAALSPVFMLAFIDFAHLWIAFLKFHALQNVANLRIFSGFIVSISNESRNISHCYLK
jgi:hypothetical protein